MAWLPPCTGTAQVDPPAWRWVVRFIRTRQVLEMIGVGRTTLWKIVQEGSFPRPVRITERNSRYLLEAVEQWMQLRTQGLTWEPKDQGEDLSWWTTLARPGKARAASTCWRRSGVGPMSTALLCFVLAFGRCDLGLRAWVPGLVATASPYSLAEGAEENTAPTKARATRTRPDLPRSRRHRGRRTPRASRSRYASG